MFQTFWAYHDLIISDLSLKLKASFESRMARHARLQFCGRITWQHPEALGACSTSSTKVMRAWTCNTGGPRATCGPIVLAHVIELDIPNPVRRKNQKTDSPNNLPQPIPASKRQLQVAQRPDSNTSDDQFPGGGQLRKDCNCTDPRMTCAQGQQIGITKPKIPATWLL